MNRNERFRLWTEYRNLPLGCYQLVIDAFEKGQLFHNDDQYASGMNSVAIGQYIYNIKIIIFNLMINHAHFIIWATGKDAVEFFIFLKKRINAELVLNGFPPLPEELGFKLIAIDLNDPFDLQNNVIYVARNPHKALPDKTPGGYIWGSNYLIFSDISKMIEKKPLREYSIRQQRSILKTKVNLPGDYLFNEKVGIILPESYVVPDKAEKILKTSWKYCGDLVKKMDAYVKISEKIGSKIVINDNELDSIIYTICKNQYNVRTVRELSIDDRCKLAVRLHNEYYIAPKRIGRKLAIEQSVLAELLA